MSNKSPVEHEFAMPVPYRGQIVLWYQNGVRNEETACPALVKVEGHSSIHLKVFGIDGEIDHTCVRHMDDPNAREYDRIENGLWDFAFPERCKVMAKTLVKPLKNPLRSDPELVQVLEDSTAL